MQNFMPKNKYKVWKSFANTPLMMNQWILSFLMSQWASSWKTLYHVSTYLEISKKWISDKRKVPKKAGNCSQLEKGKKLNWSKSTVLLPERDNAMPLALEQLFKAGWKTIMKATLAFNRLTYLRPKFHSHRY